MAIFNLFLFSYEPFQKSYETKQYKKGLKAADAILKKFPEHGGKVRNFQSRLLSKCANYLSGFVDLQHA